jgi:hypothetical protein
MSGANWPQNEDEQPLDCVRMKEELQSRIYEATKDMAREERDAYRQQQAEKFRRLLEHLAPAKAWVRFGTHKQRAHVAKTPEG